MAQDKKTIGIQRRAKHLVDDLVKETPFNQEECVARVFEWFATLPPELQAVALGQVPDTFGPIMARVLLEHMAKDANALAHSQPPADVAGTITPKPRTSPGTPRRKKAAKKRGQDESRGGKA